MYDYVTKKNCGETIAKQFFANGFEAMIVNS